MTFHLFQQEGEMRRLKKVCAAVTLEETCDIAQIFRLALGQYSSHSGVKVTENFEN